MREMSVTEQRYKAVVAVIANGRTVGEVASEWGVCRQTMHRWLARYENDGLEGLGKRSNRLLDSGQRLRDYQTRRRPGRVLRGRAAEHGRSDGRCRRESERRFVRVRYSSFGDGARNAFPRPSRALLTNEPSFEPSERSSGWRMTACLTSLTQDAPVRRQDALWHQRVRPASTRDTP